MRRRRPRVVVFFGGEEATGTLSETTGHWVCQWLPRDKYDVTPVRVSPSGKWQVPLGALPRRGPVENITKNLFEAVRPLPPVQALTRLLDKPVDAFMSLLRGKGGDDGGMRQLGDTLGVRTVGPDLSGYHKAYDKQVTRQALRDVVSMPDDYRIKSGLKLDDVLGQVQGAHVPPIVLKPAVTDASIGVQVVRNFDDLAPALRRAEAYGDYLVQPKAHGEEVVVALGPDGTLLPALAVRSRAESFLGSYSKKNPSVLESEEADPEVVRQVQTIAQDVYDEMGLSGYASMDFVVGDDEVTLLDVNTIVSAGPDSVLERQLRARGLSPDKFLGDLLR